MNLPEHPTSNHRLLMPRLKLTNSPQLPIKTTTKPSDCQESCSGMMEWNSGMEYWNGMFPKGVMSYSTTMEVG